MGSLIPYEFDDHDIVSPGYSVALLSRYPLARLGRQFAPVDADDCAPGLESIYDAMVHAADREAPCPKCGSPGGPFTGFGLAGGGFGFYAGCSDCGAFEKHQTTDEPPDDVDFDRPSPGDGYRRSNDSDDGGTP